MSKGSKRRPENSKAINDRWPFENPRLNVMSREYDIQRKIFLVE